MQDHSRIKGTPVIRIFAYNLRVLIEFKKVQKAKGETMDTFTVELNNLSPLKAQEAKSKILEAVSTIVGQQLKLEPAPVAAAKDGVCWDRGGSDKVCWSRG